ncbi:hypothetical protein LSCM4_06482 [Leishmania orientalis]|uniref:Uncharacterized protein n=1 Tax=Leishmania orientalis TaxID=2249476 RepID=A0A836GF90_9TRYP|nr:hypothetical protein LSCM4_06482 [Leishmania orientalis]
MKCEVGRDPLPFRILFSLTSSRGGRRAVQREAAARHAEGHRSTLRDRHSAFDASQLFSFAFRVRNRSRLSKLGSPLLPAHTHTHTHTLTHTSK